MRQGGRRLRDLPVVGHLPHGRCVRQREVPQPHRCRQHAAPEAAPCRSRQSRKLLYCSGKSSIDFFTSAIAACRSSRVLPDTRTASPWIDACTLSLLSLIALTIFFASSCSTPSRTVIACFTLLPETFSTSPCLSARMSTPRLVSLAVRMSVICDSLKSSSACSVSTFSLLSTRASDPLKSKRVPTSLFVWSTALPTSTLFTSETMSNEGMAVFLATVNGVSTLARRAGPGQTAGVPLGEGRGEPCASRRSNPRSDAAGTR